jgi:hypothetical protein
MKTVTIGHTKENGDFAVLATLNNNGGYMSERDFNELRTALVLTMANYTGLQLAMLERQDTPDCVDIG